MRIHLLLASLAVLAASTAHAQPAPTESVDAAAPAASSSEPTVYVQLGGATGAELFDSSYSGVTAEAGYRIGGPLWIHGLISTGNAEIQRGLDFFDSTPPDLGTYKMARVGIELRGYLMGTNGILGGFVGFDVGRRDITTDMETESRGLGLLRAGLDLGGQHVRVRPALAIGSDASVELAGAVAYQW